MDNTFKTKCDDLRDRLDILNKKVELLQQQIIIQDLTTALGLSVSVGRRKITGFDGIEEIIIDHGDTFTIINQSKNKYYSYVVYTERKFYFMGLGYKYKDDIVAPHIDSADKLLLKYNEDELKDISKLIDKSIIEISQDISYLDSNPNPSDYAHYYGEYNKGFDSLKRFNSIQDVINDFHNL